MSTPGSYKQTIPAIQSTDPVKASIVNRPINALAERTDYLRAILDDITSSEFTYVRNVAVTAETEAGNVVYWDAENNAFAPALAKWDENTLNPDGTLKPSEEAVVIGVLVYKFTSTTGSIVLGGYLRDFAYSENLFGTASPTAGVYYLSADEAGQVTSTTPPLAIVAVVSDGQGNLWIPTVRYEHSTHDHKKYELEDGEWLVANSTNFPGMDIPSGATYGYDLENASEEIKAIFTLYPGIAAYTYKTSAANIPDSLITINQDNFWWFDAAVPSDDIYVWLTAPNSHGPNIVRAIQTNTPDVLTITLTNGLATIDKPAYTATTGEAGYIVVKDITETNEKKRGQVVEKIVPGSGITIVSSTGNAGQGVVEIAQTQFIPNYIPATLINLNNALEYTVSDVIYTAFPAQRDSSMIAVAQAPEWNSGTKDLAIWFWMRGPSGGGNPLPDIAVEVRVFPDPSASPQPIPGVPYTHTLSRAGTTENSKYYLVETDTGDRISITSGSMIQYKLSLNNATDYDYLVLRQGIIVY